jgi:hypothetical protein
VIRALLLPLVLLAGCAGVAMPDPARLPRDSVEGAGDPTRAAVSRSAYAFARPEGLAGRPGEAARAIADMEFLAAALPFDPRYQQRDPLLPQRLALARSEWRGALGIAPEQPAQPVIDGLYAVARASAEGQMLALPEGVFTTGGLARLQDLPSLPQTAQAAAAASRVQSEMQFPMGRRRF